MWLVPLLITVYDMDWPPVPVSCEFQGQSNITYPGGILMLYMIPISHTIPYYNDGIQWLSLLVR